MSEFDLVCWSCGERTHVEANRQPEFAFELVMAAEAVWMLGVLNLHNGRSLIFCNDKCATDQKKRDGSFRLRAKKVAQAKETSR